MAQPTAHNQSIAGPIKLADKKEVPSNKSEALIKTNPKANATSLIEIAPP